MSAETAPVVRDGEVTVRRQSGEGPVRVLIASSPDSRRICNDSTCLGLAYTDALSRACAGVLRAMRNDFGLVERETTVVNILRGGLNFGLRAAVGSAYGWNAVPTCFLSAQRQMLDSDGSRWQITENSYRKLRFPPVVSLVLGDVVATGTSLAYALDTVLDAVRAGGSTVRRIVFFTFGGSKAQDVLESVDACCRLEFPAYEGASAVFLEGVFSVPDTSTPLTIKLPGTDLVRRGATMSPEFVDSQYEDPAYPIERCVIYDAGSRAFSPDEYVRDVLDYWQKTERLAREGVTYRQLLDERFPGLDAGRFGAVDLLSVCERRIRALRVLLGETSGTPSTCDDLL